MIVLGYKTADLATIALPSECQCGSKECLFIYRKFLTSFWLPVIPLRKNAFIFCPSCGIETKKRAFLRKLSSQGKDASEVKKHLKGLIQQTKTPLRYYSVLIAFLALFTIMVPLALYQERADQERIAIYLDNPSTQALAIIKTSSKEYPYHIAYFSDHTEEGFIVVPWLYAYSSYSNALDALKDVKESIAAEDEDNFDEVALINKTDLSQFDIRYLQELN